MKEIGSVRCFGGQQKRFEHYAETLKCDMVFSIFLPEAAEKGPVPLVYWLSGLTCTDENFVTKAGGQRVANELGMAIVCPDTSPRGEGVPDDSEGAWDFGLGAGFYVNATEAPWAAHYQMYDYIVKELPALVNSHFPIDSTRVSIFGHSMGGHGALTIALKNPEVYKSVSAFAPIVSPLNCPWGHKALGNYIGADQSTWAEYDTCELIKTGAKQMPMLVDQGSADGFLEEQLKTELMEAAVKDAGYEATIRYQEGYDHSYYFIASFVEEHLRFHGRALG